MKIRLKVVTGEEYTVSNAFYGDSGPMESENAATVQLKFLLTKMAYVTSDQGPVIVASHIVTAQIES